MKKKMTYEEYVKLIKKEKDKLTQENKELLAQSTALNSVCNVTDAKHGELVICNSDLVINEFNNGTNNECVKLLQIIFGSNFFKELSPKEKKDCVKNGYFTKDDLDDILGNVYGNNYGISFTKPQNWTEFKNFICNCVKVVKDDKIFSKDKEKYFSILFALKSLFESKYAFIIQKQRENSFIINTYKKFITAFESAQKVNLTSDDRDLIKIALNKDPRKFLTSDGKDVDFGDAFLIFCDLYNSEFDALMEDSKNKKIEAKANKYYKRIKNIPFDVLKNVNFPKYSNDDYVLIIKKIIQKFDHDVTIDDGMLPYYTAAVMHYAMYYKIKYKDANETCKDNNENNTYKK